MKNKYLFTILFFYLFTIIPFSIQAQYGAIDSTGKIIIPFEYDQFWIYNDGYITLKKDGKVGMIDLTGKMIIPFEYQSMAPFTYGLAKVEKNGKSGYIDKKGQIQIPLQFDNAHPFKNGLAVVMNKIDRKINKGLINTKGEVVVPIEYSMMQLQDDGRYRAFRNRQISILDVNGKEIVSGIYSSVLGPDSDRYMAVLKGKTGYLDENGKEVIPFIYDRGTRFKDGLAIVVKDKNYYLIDKMGNIIPTPDSDNLNGPNDDMVTFTKNEKKGYLGLDGKEKIPAIYTKAGSFSNGFASVAFDNKMKGLINKKGETVVPFIYDYIGFMNSGYASVNKNEKVGLIDETGKVVVPLIYDEIRNFDNGFAIIRKESTYGLMDSKLNVIAPTIYDTYVYVKENSNRIWMKKDGKMGCIDFKGNLVVPFVFEEARLFEKGLSICKTDDPAAAVLAIKNNSGKAPVLDPQAKLKLQFVNQKIEGSSLHLTYRFVNEGKESVVILKPQNRIPEFGNNPKTEMIYPEFFIPVLAEEDICMYAPLFVDNKIGGSSGPIIPLKRATDFVSIPANSEIEINMSFNNFKAGICNEEITEFKFKLRYQLDKNYLNKTYFDHRIKESSLSESEGKALYEILQQAYKGIVESDEVSISMQ